MIRVAIVDDHAAVRHHLREFLQGCPELEVVAEGHNGAQAAVIAVDAAPDVLLMDLVMPGQNGRDGLEAIRACAPQLAVLILSGYPEEGHALDLLRRGAAGYLNKHCEPEQIVEAIHAVAAGQLFLPHPVARRLGLCALAEPLQSGAWPQPLRQPARAAA